MASKNMLTFSALLILLFAPQTEPLKPTSVTLPVRKDTTTGLFIVDIPRKAPLKPVPFLLDLNSKFLSANCEAGHGYLSSAYHNPLCQSKTCSLTGTYFCQKCSLGRAGDKPVGCHNSTCVVLVTNPLTRKTALAKVTQDALAVETLQGSLPGPLSILRDFIFACAPSSFFEGAPQNVKGFVGFSHDPVSLPSQIASHFGFAPRFSMCLSSEKDQSGVIFFGNPPYKSKTTSKKSFSNGLKYIPYSIGWNGEYFIPVKSIRINQKDVQFNTSLLLHPSKSSGGTMISTVAPYTALEHSIFMAFSNAFVHEFSNMGASVARVPVHPFGACFNKLPPTAQRVRIAAPFIEFVMQNQSQSGSWGVFRSNSLVQVRGGKWCLAFVDGGSNPRAAIVLGAYQLQDHIVEFDLNRSRLGFSETLPSKYNRCSQFNLNSRL